MPVNIEAQESYFYLKSLQDYNQVVKYTMQIELPEQVQEAITDFQQLQKNQSLPPLMEIKLTCLQSALQGRHINQYLIDQLPSYERLSLQQMNRQTQMNLFTSIVRCLSGRQIIIYFKNQRMFLRKEGGFFSWNKCYLTCDSKNLIFKRKKDSKQNLYVMELDKIWISKGHKQYKRKRVFSLYYIDRKHVLGFEEQITCNRIHRILTELLIQKRQCSVVKYDNSEILKQQQNKKFGMNRSQVCEMIQAQQLQFMLAIQQKINQSYLSNDNDFKLIKNIDQGRMLQHVSNSSIKINLIIQKISILDIAQYFLQFKQWNTNIDSFQILNRPRRNSYLAHLKTAKYSFISYPRDANLSIVYYQSCQCRNGSNNNHYLLIESVENEGDIINAGTVRMKYKQTIQFKTHIQKDKIVLMTILTDIDFRGYSKATDNKDMTLHLLKDIDNFAKFCQEQYITGNHISYFQPIQCSCNFKDRNSQTSVRSLCDSVSLPTERNCDDGTQIEQSQWQPNFNKTQNSQNLSVEKYVIKTLNDIQNRVINEDILEIIKSQKHYTYALSHRFTDQEEVFNNVKVNNSDFLIQKGRWKFQGDEYIFCDAQVLAAQKDILKMIIKQLSSNLLAGKSIMNMSLPVQIFDCKSMLDLIASSFGFVPYYLNKAAECNDPIQQIKYVVAGFMFISATCPNIEKPFNPIVGQTYQGVIGNIPIFLQQISHHPPISSVFIKTKQFCIYGNFDVVLNMGLNTAQSRVSNWLRAQIYTTNTNYYIKMPDIQLGGLMYGNRTFKLINKGFVFQKTNNIFCEYSIGKDKKRVYESSQKLKGADLAGGIFKLKNQFADKILTLDRKKNFDGVKAEDIVETYCFLSGKWYGNLFFDKVSYKSITDGPFPEKSYRQKYLLASDCIFRQDVIFKKWNNNERSNQQKQHLENRQRNDKKLREKHRNK